MPIAQSRPDGVFDAINRKPSFFATATVFAAVVLAPAIRRIFAGTATPASSTSGREQNGTSTRGGAAAPGI